jgi:ferredoxin-NADP reductase
MRKLPCNEQPATINQQPCMKWQTGEVIKIVRETHRVKTITILLQGWSAHLPGQHYDIRLTAEDGYQAQRSYSVASPPGQQGSIDLTVDYIEDGEVSPYLVEGISVGDTLELRGPIGGYFAWTPAEHQKPLLLVAGGSGIVPLMAMLRHRKSAGTGNDTQLVYSVRSPADLIFGQELEALAREDSRFRLHLTFTRTAPAGWRGYHQRIDEPMLRELLGAFAQFPLSFICGPTLLVEAAANALRNAGLPPESIRTEHFGISNG